MANANPIVPTIESEPFQRFCYAGRLVDQYLKKVPLTGIQEVILRHLQDGKTQAEIADLLGLGEKHRSRVTNHIESMTSKGWRAEMKPLQEH